MKLPQKIIDANVILRFFLADDEDKFLKAKEFIKRLEFGEDEALLTEIVFVEIIWVLNKVYNIPRKEISAKCLKLINMPHNPYCAELFVLIRPCKAEP